MTIAPGESMKIFWFRNRVAEPVGGPRQCASRNDGGNVAAHRRLALDAFSRITIGYSMRAKESRRQQRKREERKRKERTRQDRTGKNQIAWD